MRPGPCLQPALLAGCIACTAVDAGGAETDRRASPANYTVVGDAIPASLTGAKGDPARGRAIVVNRQLGLCLLCHSGPFPEEPLQGDLASDLRGAGSRWSEGQLRLRIVDPSRVEPETVMPAFHRTDGLRRVAPAWRGKPLLSREQVEDVVAFLMTLREAGPVR